MVEGAEAGAPATPATPAAVGTEARIEDFDATPEGLLTLRVRGARRFRVRRTRVRADGLILGDVDWCAPDPESAFFAQLAATAGASRHPQSGGDLGARMAHAISAALTRHPAVLLIGTDCPLLDVAYLARAAGLLAGHDAVLGPAEDGGYVLVGATRPLPFAEVRWSSPHALADTEAAFAAGVLETFVTVASWCAVKKTNLSRKAKGQLHAAPLQRVRVPSR